MHKGNGATKNGTHDFFSNNRLIIVKRHNRLLKTENYIKIIIAITKINRKMPEAMSEMLGNSH